MEVSQHIQATLDNAPTKPGCYLMKNGEGQVIYVGKAINLRNRLRSYFHESAQEDRKTRKLVRSIVEIEWILVGSELEALILEMNLIKKYRPHFNVRLKDDKRYPYIKVHWNMPFPKLTVTRRVVWAWWKATCRRSVHGTDAASSLRCSGPSQRWRRSL